MRRYAEVVEVHRGRVDDVEGPAMFLWRDALWRVQTVQASWVETGRWWEQPVSIDLNTDLLCERTVYRVQAGCGRHGHSGVFDLAFDWASNQWRLEGVAD